MPVAVKHDVVQLEITVNDATIVQEADAQDYLSRVEPEGRGEGEGRRGKGEQEKRGEVRTRQEERGRKR